MRTLHIVPYSINFVKFHLFIAAPTQAKLIHSLSFKKSKKAGGHVYQQYNKD